MKVNIEGRESDSFMFLEENHKKNTKKIGSLTHYN
jgi:hypothetical protein